MTSGRRSGRALGLAAAVWLAAAGPARARAAAVSAPRPNVILVVVDALRADHLGVYGYERATSPRLDALAARGAVFQQVIAQATWTIPALSSLMTSLYPSVHGAVLPPEDPDWNKKLDANRFVAGAGERLPDGLPTLAEALHREGYRTIGVVSGGFCRSAFGFGRGFDEYVNEGARMDKLNDIIASRLETRRDRPFFLYVHVGDVHDPYGGPPEGRDRWSPGYQGPVDGSRASLRLIRTGRIPLDDAVKRRVIALYDAGVSYTDEQLGVLLDRLDRLGLSSTTIVAVTADHGDQLFERGWVGHGNTLYDELLRIPLVLSGPGVPPGARVAAQVRQIDIAPTLLDLAGARPLPDAEGRSLRPWLEGRRSDDLDAMSEIQVLGSTRTLASWRTPAWKYLFAPEGEALYDLKGDPGERTDLSSREPRRARRLRAKLEKTRAAALRLRARLSPATGGVELDAGTREKLKAEGYLK